MTEILHHVIVGERDPIPHDGTEGSRRTARSGSYDNGRIRRMPREGSRETLEREEKL
jgi:hypothetical protein